MSTVLNAAALYVVMLVLFRLSGRRSLGQATPFDFVLLLLVGEATQQAMLGDDTSLTNAVIAIATLLSIDVGFSLVKRRFPLAERLVEGVPTIVLADGKVLQERVRRARISEGDILQSARSRFGILDLHEVRYAILEPDGAISIVPRERADAAAPARTQAP